jgi:cytochrome c-type biogenesis protein CcmH
MSPSLTLAQFKEVVVGARISKSGSPTPKPGDLEGLRQPVKVGTDRVDLVIDTVVQ